ncbi:MAG: Uma2 family endonuclease [Planctomycetes bacterium]|nr:Uma2 family endonuclease [Planctomycetota bacterium]
MGAAVKILIQPEGVRIPAGFRDLDAFRAWARSDDFPERGRIDWIGGEVEVDMSPEDLTTHGTLKLAIARRVCDIVEEENLGVVLTDSFRLSSDVADLSSEPDVLVLLKESVDAGRVHLIPKAGAPAGRFVEVEGAADLVVECVSDSSANKDRIELVSRYHAAGVREYWVVDGRREEIDFTLYRMAPERHEIAPSDPQGFRSSAVLDRGVRIRRIPIGSGLVRYDLELR